MSTEQELLAQIEALRKKAKEVEEENKDAEFNKQRNFLIKTVRDFLEIEVSDEEVLAILYKYYPIQQSSQQYITYYLEEEDENMLFERKVSNRYARHHEIRCEDSDMIFYNFLRKIKPLTDLNEFNREQHNKSEEHKKKLYLLQQEYRRNNGFSKQDVYPNTQYVPEKYLPLFC